MGHYEHCLLYVYTGSAYTRGMLLVSRHEILSVSCPQIFFLVPYLLIDSWGRKQQFVFPWELCLGVYNVEWVLQDYCAAECQQERFVSNAWV